MRKVIISILVVISVSFADTLVVNKSGYSTYIQKNEFILPEGESVVGPIKLIPMGKIENLIINPQSQDVSVVGYIFEPPKESWLDNIVGKTISVEGDGRVITGTVISVKDGYITLDTKRGVVITTIPNFPNRLSSPFSWQEILSPRITVRLKSNRPQNTVLDILYPVGGFSWEVNYVGKISRDKVQIYEFYTIKNDTFLSLKDVELYIKDGEKLLKLYNKTYIEPYTSKVLKFREFVGNVSGKTIKVPQIYNIPASTINLYKDNVFLGTFRIVNNSINLP